MKETIIFAATLLETLAVSFAYWSDMALQEDIEKTDIQHPIIAKDSIKKTKNPPLPLSVKKKSLVELHLQPKKRSVLNPT